jgi:MFS family permease
MPPPSIPAPPETAGVTIQRNWFSGLSGQERRTFVACFGGWALDAMDVQMYALIMPTLIAAWHMSKSQAGMLASSALVLSSVGGWLAGMLADRLGRARVLQITIAWFAVFTFASGLTQNYEQLLVTRGLQGLGFGGEWAAGAVLMGEVIDKRYRGRAVGCVQSGWAVGYGISVLLFSLVFSLLPPAVAWRSLFFLGLLPAFAVLWIRRAVPEPEIFQHARAAVAKPAMGEIFRGTLLRNTIVASLLSFGALGGNYTILTWLPTYLKTTHHLSVLSTGSYLAVNILGSFAGYVIGAHLTDFLGRRRTFALMALCASVTVGCYTMAPVGGVGFLALGFPLGFFQSGIVSGIGATLAELFPTRVRATGQGFCYNLGRGLGSVMPALVGYLGDSADLGPAIGICAISAYAMTLLAAWLLPETCGRELRADD